MTNSKIGNIALGEVDVEEEQLDEMPQAPQQNYRRRRQQDNVHPPPPLPPPPQPQAVQHLIFPNEWHAKSIITRNGRGENEPTSIEKKFVNGDQIIKEEGIPQNGVQVQDDIQIDIDNRVEETLEEVNPSRENIIDILDSVVQKAKVPLPNPPPYTLKGSLSKMLVDPDTFTIPCIIRSANFAKSLCDLSENINLMPYSVIKPLGIGKPRPITMRLKMADRTMKRPLGVIEDVFVRVDQFIHPADFVILDCEVDYEVPIIPGRSFLSMDKTLCDVEVGELTFGVGDERVVFHVCKSMRQRNSNEVCSFVESVNDVIVDDTTTKTMLVDSILAVLQRRKKAIRWNLADIRAADLLLKLRDGMKRSADRTQFVRPQIKRLWKK
uniref:Uncharacterized protein n=1 Tax=Nicotiana tabacum TaxID=4097 RepID=A0A1S4BPF9_TOBAC|nr:PREDICTED: uncharacterized protein LOC107810493 [Nicotiana tabacum]